ncbi:MAG TPA: type III secretion system inner membrane ring subunit SctD [Rhabdochlamydiaceae bacterium]|nr:type III secretion system inner membrane ring subunit SctD [Rhabdochlamydiaceae bacterium]
MAGYLIGEEGPLAGLVVKFEEGSEWIMGRDPDVVGIVLEDPMVSRKHVICRLTAEGYILENLSAVNPATQNGMIISEPVLLREGDIIQIGNTFFRFSEKLPKVEVLPPSLMEEPTDLTSLSVTSSPDARWMIKVITGPNSGAEFYMHKGKTYVIGKDPELSDIIFQDLSVSRQHARITVDESDMVYIEDLGSRNGTIVGGKMITDRHLLNSQDQIFLGTTSFLVIDLQQSHETLISEAPPVVEEAPAETMTVPVKNWREIVILKKHLILAGVIGVFLLGLIVSMVSLFNSEPIVVSTKDESSQVKEIVTKYPDIQFSYNKGSEKLFLTGHVLTTVEKQELMFQLKGLPFITTIEDSVVIDEYVWENINALLMTNPAWQGISITSPAPGKFVVRGYLQTLEQGQALSDYLNVNFPYLDRLDNQVVVESNLTTQVQSMLTERGFNNVTYQLVDGEIVLSGRVDGKDSHRFNALVKDFKALAGVRMLKNYVVYTNEESSLVDLSSKYKVMGYSKKDGANQFIVINGKILSLGDTLDGMTITAISPTAVMLEKDGLKFKINYNLQ